MYKSIVFDTPLSEETNARIIRVRLFELGHSFEYIDGLSVKEIGDIVGYWTGKSKAEKRQARSKH